MYNIDLKNVAGDLFSLCPDWVYWWESVCVKLLLTLWFYMICISMLCKAKAIKLQIFLTCCANFEFINLLPPFE